MNKTICTFGSNKHIDNKEDIIKLGRLLAEKGFRVVSGGFGGTMEDISKGAKSKGGATIGVTFYKKKDSPYKKANKYIDKEIKTKSVFERIEKMMEISDAFIVLPGATGTLFELVTVLEHINKGIMKAKPIVALGNYWKSVADKIKDQADLITFADSPENVIEKLVF